MSHSHIHNKTLHNQGPRRSQEFSEHSLPRRGRFHAAGLDTNHSPLISSCPARDCACLTPQLRSNNSFNFASERANTFCNDMERFYPVSQCGSQISKQSSQISRAGLYETNPSAQYDTSVDYRPTPEPEQCQMHGTPALERRRRHGDCDQQGYAREYDVASMVSEIEHLSLYSASSRKQSSASSADVQNKVKKVSKRRRQDPNFTKSEPSSPGHSCHSQNTSPGHSYSAETRGTWSDDQTTGCCTIQTQETGYDNLISGNNCPAKEPMVSNCVKNFMSWMAEKAEKGTSAFLDSLPSISKENFHVVMIGLDGAGKTTALYRLKFDQYMNTVPTVGFNCERVKGTVGKSKGLTFLIWDVGGQEKIRPLWRSYTRCTDGIIFVLDSSEEDKFEEAKVELLRTMRYQDNSNIPLLVLANKQDLQSAWSVEEVEEALGLNDLGSTLWHVEPSCSVIGEGLDTALDQLQRLIAKRKKMTKRNRNKTK